MKAWGVLLIIVGVICGYLVGTMHSSVESGLGLGVNSLGLNIQPNPELQPEQLPELKIETKSPDTAVKSWWSMIDYEGKLKVDECVKYKDSYQKSEEQVYKSIQQITNGALLAYKTPKPLECKTEKFNREITEVKPETETRAVVYATIKNVTPVPEGAQPTADNVKKRKDGYKFKYVLEKDSGGWKVVQVYRYEEINRILGKDDLWDAKYQPSNEPSYPEDVYFQ
ncbi:MAG: hypothetical protein PHH11_16735 [Methylomonas sp.]|nr:hypothetical protein [Methylomonas sp.]